MDLIKPLRATTINSETCICPATLIFFKLGKLKSIAENNMKTHTNADRNIPVGNIGDSINVKVLEF